MPRLLKPVMWPPAIPVYTDEISQPAMSSASSTAFLMDSTVASMLTTTPLRRPTDGWVPMPMMLIVAAGHLAHHGADLGRADVQSHHDVILALHAFSLLWGLFSRQVPS